MQAFVVVMIAWLSPDGSVAAIASGYAADVPTCEAMAEKSITEQQASDPRLKGLTGKFACWDVRPQARAKPSKHEGSVEL